MDTAKLQFIDDCVAFSKTLHAYQQNKSQHGHDAHLDNLSKYQTTIIHNLGGLDNIIQHCLGDSSYVSKNLNDANLSILKQLLTIGNCKNDMQMQQHDDQMTKSKTTHDQPPAIDIMEYKFTPTIVTVDVSNNFYFRNLSYKIASFFYYKIALSKTWFTLTSSVGFFCWILAQVLRLTYGDSFVFFQLIHMIPDLCIVFYAWTLLFAANINVIKLIFTTFDFWYKAFNVILIIISWFLYEYFSESLISKWSIVRWFSDMLWAFSWLSAFIGFSILDAVRFSNTSKLAMSLLLTSICVYSSIVWYFLYPNDANFNPFSSLNIQETNIDFKFMRVTAYGNLGLFTARPLYRWLLKRCCKRQNSNPNKSNYNYKCSNNYNFKDIRAMVLYQRPILRWPIESIDPIAELSTQLESQAKVTTCESPTIRSASIKIIY